MANETRNVQQPLLETSSEMDEVPCITSSEHASAIQSAGKETSFPAQAALIDSSLDSS